MQAVINPPIPINAMDLRREPGQYLDRVYYRKERFVVQRAGEPKAVLIPVSEYQQVQRIQAGARARFFAQSEQMRAAFADLDDIELRQLIDEALTAARASTRKDI
jgi:prevent-host-death family protein